MGVSHAPPQHPSQQSLIETTLAFVGVYFKRNREFSHCGLKCPPMSAYVRHRPSEHGTSMQNLNNPPFLLHDFIYRMCSFLFLIF